ncbi:uncharacterized protein [Diadema antillarum]|uniref:uncharacterized protein n=1 Tax=Diadema antillarum TaxID=105358 RepID=UPI003A863FA5
MQSRPHFLQQLNYLRARCIELGESEKAAVGTRQCLYRGGQTQGEDDKRHHDGEMFGPSSCSLDECIWRIEERLQGYEECIGRLFADLQNWKSEKWMKALEDNHCLLTGSRWVKKMLESCLILAERESGTLTRVEADTWRRLLKLSSKCFAALPLPLQCCVFQWLWEQPKGRVLYQVDSPINVQQELTRVFNHLVTGVVDTQIIKAAQEFCWVALHSLGPALQKTIEEAVSSQDAGKLLCKVLQCLPFLLQLEVDGRPCFLVEFRKFVEVFCKEDHQSTEKLNLLRFTETLMQRLLKCDLVGNEGVGSEDELSLNPTQEGSLAFVSDH